MLLTQEKLYTVQVGLPEQSLELPSSFGQLIFICQRLGQQRQNLLQVQHSQVCVELLLLHPQTWNDTI